MVTIKVRTLTGKLHPIETTLDSTVAKFKSQIISSVGGIPLEGLKLVFTGKLLDNELTLEQCKLKNGDFVVLLISRKPQPPPDVDFTPITQKDITQATQLYITTEEEKDKVSQQEQENKKEKEKMEESDNNTITEESEEHKILPTDEEKMKELLNSLVDSLTPESMELSKNDGNSTEEIKTVFDFDVDPAPLQQLMDMGFSEAHARKALLLHGMNMQVSLDWLFIHSEDADIDTPLTEEQIIAIDSAVSSFTPNELVLQQLLVMGFTESEAETALRMSNNNGEMALAWLLGENRQGTAEDDEVDEEEFSETDKMEGDEDSPIPYEVVNKILGNAAMKEALKKPRIVKALELLIADPSQTEQFLDDEEIGPILRQVNKLLSTSKS
eukprot:CAMPEP_0174250264 /NCGR_PEP_ID=MMETSP0439-20130205/491_1 /TAXON_ID=0 /ORGANISM="Stereomyxa ramosa, Strain Chinc5" /LENGTH=383 /DNA_ID=CAMNT_0015330283 /DNA_START=8 /DNA_END=1159 /DNA_ORIENTATION=+